MGGYGARLFAFYVCGDRRGVGGEILISERKGIGEERGVREETKVMRLMIIG